MTRCIDVRDVDHAVDMYARTTQCEDHRESEHCPRCLLIELLRQAPRFEAAALPW